MLNLPQIGVALLLALLEPATAARLLGDPPVTRITPDLEEVYPQSYQITVAADGIIYIGAANGVLRYDGGEWRQLTLPAESHARSLRSDGHGRIYVGGFDELGYFQRAADGTDAWVDLTDQAKAFTGDDSFADIWRVNIFDGLVYFGALRDVFRYDPSADEMRHWQHEGRFGAMARIGDEVWLQFRGEGMRRRSGDDWEPVPDTDHLTAHLFEIFERPDGSYVGMLQGGAWAVLNRQASTPDYASLLGNSEAYVTGAALPNGSLALTTSQGELVILDQDQTLRRTRISRDWIPDIALWGDQGHLLAISGLELFALKWPPSWSATGANQGLTGSIYGVEAYGDETLVHGSSGIHRVGADGMLVRLDWTSLEVWDVARLPDRVLVADSYQVLRVLDATGAVDAVSGDDLYPNRLLPSRFHEGLVWLFSDEGLGRYDSRTDRVTLVATRLETVDTLVELSADAMLVASSAGGILHLRINENADIVEETALPGFVDEPAFLELVGDEVYATGDDGLFRYDAATGHFVADTMHGLLDLDADYAWFNFHASPGGTIYAFSGFQVMRREPDGEWETLPIASVGSGAINSLDFPYDDTPYFGVGKELLAFNGSAEERSDAAATVQLLSVERNGNGVESNLPLAGDQRWERDTSAIDFRFGLIDPDAPEAVRYRWRLVGMEGEFGPWSRTSYTAYSSLPAGQYRFELQGRASDGLIREAQPYSFDVLPRWYETRQARILGISLIALASLLLGLAVMHRRSRMLRLRNTQLEQAVRERTRDLRRANRKLATLANQDGLTGLANRRQFDACLQDALAGEERHTALIMADFDHFKEYNDRNGHLAGDEALRAFANHLTEMLEDDATALAARYGGEEFAIILTDHSAQQIELLARRIHGKWTHHCTISLGYAIGEPRDTPQALIARADQALYLAKQSGRDRVVAA